MRTTALPFRLFAGLLLTTLSVGCDEPTAADLAMEDGEEADETAPGNAVPEAGLEAEVDPQGILGGNSLDSDRDVMVLNATTPEPCSGTLLRNNVVLTARHCVAVGGEEDEPALVDASELFVLQDGPGDSWADGEGVAEIAVIPGTYVDVALVRLSSAMTIDGEVRGESTEIWPRPDVDMVGEAALCQGYGAIECIESRYGTPIGAADAIGRLRWGLVNIHGVNDNGEDWMILKTLSSSGNWLPSAGDSGSACRLPWFAQRNRQRITGVVSEGSVCEGHPGEDGWSAFEVQPSVFRDWARGQMAEWAGGDFDDDYSSGYLASVVSPPDIPTNTVQTMWFTYILGGDAKLFQFYDDYEMDPITQEGTKRFYDSTVIDDGQVSVDVLTHDRDVAGIVARARDEDQYYRFSVDERNGIAKLVVRDGSSFTTLATEPTSIDFSTNPRLEFSMQGNVLTGYVDGQQVVTATDADWTYVAGRVGPYTYAMSSTIFDNFLVEH